MAWLSGTSKDIFYVRILLAQNTVYYPSLGGANKANRGLMQALAARNHSCSVVAPASLSTKDSIGRVGRTNAAASRRQQDEGVTAFDIDGVRVHAVLDRSGLRREVVEQQRLFSPDVTFVASEDPGQMLLDAVVHQSSSKTVVLAQTQVLLPFGPGVFLASAAGTRCYRNAAAIVTSSHFLADYVKTWAGIDAHYFPYPLLSMDARCANTMAPSGPVLVVNPCQIKGVSIVLEVVRRMPLVRFVAVPSWGTTQTDRESLLAFPNVKLAGPFTNIDEMYRGKAVILMPSLVCEGLPLTPIEAMLRGLPVVGSRLGGLPETLRGIDYTVPVQPITSYRSRFDERLVPIPVLPNQDVEPWVKAMEELFSNARHLLSLSDRSRAAALEYTASIDIGGFEVFLESVVQSDSPLTERSGGQREPAPPAATGQGTYVERRQELSAAQRRWLVRGALQRSRKKNP